MTRTVTREAPPPHQLVAPWGAGGNAAASLENARLVTVFIEASSVCRDAEVAARSPARYNCVSCALVASGSKVRASVAAKAAVAPAGPKIRAMAP